MNKKGIAYTTVMGILLVAFLIVLLALYLGNNVGWFGDKPKWMIDDFLEKSESYQITQGMKCSVPDNVDNNIALIKKTAEGHNINGNLMVAVAEQESNVKHCWDNGNVKAPGSEGNKDIGIMQVNQRTAKGSCPDANLYDLLENVQCGVFVMKEKYAMTSTSEAYIALVDRNCNKDENPDEYANYISYASDPDKRALRAYNGFSCSRGDVAYVENVWENMVIT